MVNLLKIRELIELKKLRINDFCESVGITTQGLRDMERRNSTNLATLERISLVLGVPITFFFQSNGNEIETSEAALAAFSGYKRRTGADSQVVLNSEEFRKEIGELRKEIRSLERENGILQGRLMEIIKRVSEE